MSIPSTKHNLGHQPSITIAPRLSTGHVEKYEKSSHMQTSGMISAATLSKKAMKQQLLLSSHNARRKYGHSKHAVEHESSEDKDNEDTAAQHQFRCRSKTISDTSGINQSILYGQWSHI